MMDFVELYHFLFETYAGIGILVGAGIIISIIACVIFEFNTRRKYKNHAPAEDEWSLFYDEMEEGEEEMQQEDKDR